MIDHFLFSIWKFVTHFCCCYAGGDTVNLLYWWQVLDDEQMLQVTLTVLPTHLVGNNESVPSVLTMSSEKRKKKDTNDNIAEKIGTIADTLSRTAAIQDRVNDLNNKRFRAEQRKEIREVEREIESMEDQLDETEHDGKRQRLQVRIKKLQTKLTQMEVE
jgi:hypothetical protein